MTAPEEWKAWSQNLGHESGMTTFVGYGQVPGHRQAEIMLKLRSPQPHHARKGGLLNALKTLLHNAKRDRDLVEIVVKQDASNTGSWLNLRNRHERRRDRRGHINSDRPSVRQIGVAGGYTGA